MSRPTPPQPRHPELVSGSIGQLARSQRWQTQPHRQIVPIAVLVIHQIDLPLPMPAFELFFAPNRAFHVAKHLEVDQPVNPVSRGKAGYGASTMLPQPLEQTGGDADVERAVGRAGEDVDAGLALLAHGFGCAAQWMLKQVQHDGAGVAACR